MKTPRWLLAKYDSSLVDFLISGALIVERKGTVGIICVEEQDAQTQLDRLRSGMRHLSRTIYTSKAAAEQDAEAQQ